MKNVLKRHRREGGVTQIGTGEEDGARRFGTTVEKWSARILF